MTVSDRYLIGDSEGSLGWMIESRSLTQFNFPKLLVT